MGTKTRELGELISVGPAMLRDFEMLGILSVKQLAKQEPARMYRRLERITESPQDPCVLDVFCAAVAQARDPRLPVEQSQWWYWSRKRKSDEKVQKETSRKTGR
jgi:pathogenicity locus Cdd1 protein